MLRRLLLLNGLATLGVVANHSLGWGFTAMFWWTARYQAGSTPNFDQLGTLSYFGLRTIEQLIIFAVPTFLFVSGFFVAAAAGRTQRTISWRVVGVRLLYLLIPYLLWSTLIFAMRFAEGARYTPIQLARILLSGQATEAYYFVPLLCQLYLLAPFLIPPARRRWKLLLAVTAVVQLSVQSLLYLATLGQLPAAPDPLMFLTRTWLFPGHLFFFALGIVAGFHIKELGRLLERVRWPLLATVVLLLPLGVVEWERVLSASGQQWIGQRVTILDSVYAVAFILTLLAFHRVTLPFAEQTETLGTRSYGIYLAHSPVLELTARGIYHGLPWLLAYQALFQPILLVVGLGVPLALMAMASLQRSPTRAYYQYIFG